MKRIDEIGFPGYVRTDEDVDELQVEPVDPKMIVRFAARTEFSKELRSRVADYLEKQHGPDIQRRMLIKTFALGLWSATSYIVFLEQPGLNRRKAGETSNLDVVVRSGNVGRRGTTLFSEIPGFDCEVDGYEAVAERHIDRAPE